MIFKKNIHCLKCSKTPLINLQYINNEPIICYKCQDDHMGKIPLSQFLENSQNIKYDFNCTICNQLLEDNCYYCINCQIITCEKCKLIHDKENNHNSLESYIENENLCTNHCTSVFAYCLQCKKNICTYCKNHLQHEKFILFDHTLEKAQINKYIQSIEKVKKFIIKINEIQNKIKDFYLHQINFCDKIFNTYKKINEDEIKLCEILLDNYNYRFETHSITYPVIKNIQNILQFNFFDNINFDTQFNYFNSEKYIDFFKNITNSILIDSGPLLDFEGIEITKDLNADYNENKYKDIKQNDIKIEIKNDEKEIKINNNIEIKKEKSKKSILEDKNVKIVENDKNKNKKIRIKIENISTLFKNEEKDIKNKPNFIDNYINEIQNITNENKKDKNEIEYNKINKKEEKKIKNKQKQIENNIEDIKCNKKRERSHKKEKKKDNKRKKEKKQKTNRTKKLELKDIYNQKDDNLPPSMEIKKEINTYSNSEINQDNNLNNIINNNKKEIIINEMIGNDKNIFSISRISPISPISTKNENNTLKSQNDESKEFFEDCLNVISKKIKETAKKDEPKIKINLSNTLLSNNTNLSLNEMMKIKPNLQQINKEKKEREDQKDLSNKSLSHLNEEENPQSYISMITSSVGEVDTQVVSSEFNKSNKSINNLNSLNSKIPKEVNEEFLCEKFNELIKIIPPLENTDISKLEIKLIKESKNDRYYGEMLGNKRHGRGIWYVDNGLYEGYFMNDLANGYGKFISPNGDIFTGDWENSNKKKGTEIFNNGNVFKGEYKNDHFSFGTMIYKDKKEIFKGQFKNNKKYGKGVLTVIQNDEEVTYEGEWFNDKLNGSCVIKYSSGDIEEAVYNYGNLYNKKKKFDNQKKKWIEL